MGKMCRYTQVSCVVGSGNSLFLALKYGVSIRVWAHPVSCSSDKEVNDFVDRCASETLILKACVDNNPEYYFVVADNEQDKETIERAKAKKAQEEEEKDRRTLDFLASYGT